MQGSMPREPLVFYPVMWENGFLEAFLKGRRAYLWLTFLPWFAEWKDQTRLALLCGEGLALCI